MGLLPFDLSDPLESPPHPFGHHGIGTHCSGHVNQDTALAAPAWPVLWIAAAWMAITSVLVHPARSLGKWEFTWPRIMQIALQFCRFLTHPLSSTTHMKTCSPGSLCFRLPCRSFQKFKVTRKPCAEPCRSWSLGLNRSAVKVKLHSNSGVILCLENSKWGWEAELFSHLNFRKRSEIALCFGCWSYNSVLYLNKKSSGNPYKPNPKYNGI